MASDPQRPLGRGEHMPTAEEFSPRAVQRAVLKETLQHPLTILPAAVSVLSGLYMGLISFDPTSLGLGFGAALFGAASWVVNYFMRGERYAEVHVQTLRALREAHKQRELESLRNECAASGFQEAVESAHALTQAYETLNRYLQSRAEAGSLSATRFRVLAEDTYREGVDILRVALENHRALKEVDAEKLRDELPAWEAEVRSIERKRGAETDPEARLPALQAKLESHRRRLGVYDDRMQVLHKLLAQVEVLEAALENAYLEVLEIGGSSSPAAPGQAAEKLEQAIAAARRVEERLRLSRDTEEGDRLYLPNGGRDA